MRKKIKKDIQINQQNDKNPYRNSQSEAYRKMKENTAFEKSEVSSGSDKSDKKKKSKKVMKSFFCKNQKKKGSESSFVDNTLHLENDKCSKNTKSIELTRSEKNGVKKRNTIQEKKAKKKKVISRSRKITVFTFCVTLMFAFVFIILIYRNTQIVRLKYNINELNKELLNLENEKEMLEVQMESSNRSDVIEKYAREQLGMDYPKENKITYIKVN